MSEPKFSFGTESYPAEFELIGFTGTESISKLYEFTLSLKVTKSKVSQIDFQAVVNEGCSLTVSKITGINDDYIIGGMLKSIDEEFHGSNTHKYYTAVMVPALWRQSKNKSYDIYVDQPVDAILSEELSQDVMIDHQLSLTQTYPNKPFICQYSESNFDFVARLSNHWGIYYYFDHEQQGKLIFADDTNYDNAAVAEADLDVSNNPATSFTTVRTLRKTFNATPAGVVVSETNPDQASEHFEGQAGDTDGKNCIHMVNESCDNLDEAKLIADIRLEEYQCDAIEFVGTSGIPCLAPGFVLAVNTPDGETVEILLTSVSHSASHLDDSHRAGGNANAAHYEATFTGIPRDVQYRPEHNKVSKPRAISTTARIHSDDDKKNIAQRNEIGKYQVIFDFLKDEKKVSNWIRLARNTARTNHMDMPLTPGTEVQISFVDGNPDRPFIQSALENSQSVQHPVTNANPHHASIRTDGMLYTEAAKSRQEFHVSGTHEISDAYENRNNNPFPRMDYNGVDSGNLVDEVVGNVHVRRRYGDEYLFIQGNDYTYADGKCVYNFGNDYTENHAYTSTAQLTFDITDSHLYSSDASQVPNGDVEASKQVALVEKTFGNTYNYHSGVESNWANGPDGAGIHKTFNYGGRYEENQCNDLTARVDDMSGFPGSPGDSDLVTKTYGNTFEFQEGDQCEVLTGNVTSEITGDIEETITGNQTSTVTGDICENITGNQEVTATGDVTENITGNITTTLMGDVNETHTGNVVESHVGDVIGTYTGNVVEDISGNSSVSCLGAVSEFAGGASSVIYGGLANDMYGGGKLEIHSGVFIENKNGTLGKNQMDIQEAKAAVVKKAQIITLTASLMMLG